MSETQVEGNGSRMEVVVALDELIKACKEGRPIVPLLGAGISVSSGYPPTRMIVNYLAKVHYYLKRLYLPSPDEGAKQNHDSKDNNDFKRQYLYHFGWPDPYWLNDVLWAWGPKSSTQMNNEINKIYREAWRRDAKDLLNQLEEVQSDQPQVPQPHWRPFLRWVTDCQADHVDSLFQMFNRGRVPSNSHRFLAFLVRLLNWKLILTTNFDDLIEKALRSEDLEPTVFDVWRQAELPNRLLVGSGLSVVKLHGSAYGLRAGESLDDPLSKEEKQKLLEYMPEGACCWC